MNDHEYLSLTDLGKRFGVTSRVCGQWLADLGLRVVGGSPTDEAFAMGLVRKISTNRGTGGYYYIWYARKTLALLEKAGHERLGASDSPDGESAQPATDGKSRPTGKALVGPFDVAQNGDGWLIRNGDGVTVYWTFDEVAADFGSRLLTLAYRSGVGPFREGAEQ